MQDKPKAPFPPLLQRLKNHVENDVPLNPVDLQKAFQPGCLVYAAMVAGNLSRWRGKRIKGNSAYPLTHDAAAYQRAHDLALKICEGLEERLTLAITIIDGRGASNRDTDDGR